MKKWGFLKIKALLLGCFAVSLSHAQSPRQSPIDVDKSINNLMVVLRESLDSEVRPDESLEFIGKGVVLTKDGKEIKAEFAHYAYIGDTHIRFVFDGPEVMVNATPSDLSRLNLTPEQALQVALGNIRRVYGPARPVAFVHDIMELESKSEDLISSYFLDKTFWNKLEKENPQGIVAVVPRRGGLLYTAATHASAVESLKQKISYLHSSSEQMRISSGVYLYRGGKWSILQPPHKPPTMKTK